mmetsp:Transcript_74027/g.233814  ORF Transcript_74027/g.233814 Transcript_74027/m.233814 type:complete len:200 (-) Transcript_74027:162-761(-)
MSTALLLSWTSTGPVPQSESRLAFVPPLQEAGFREGLVDARGRAGLARGLQGRGPAAPAARAHLPVHVEVRVFQQQAHHVRDLEADGVVDRRPLPRAGHRAVHVRAPAQQLLRGLQVALVDRAQQRRPLRLPPLGDRHRGCNLRGLEVDVICAAEARRWVHQLDPRPVGRRPRASRGAGVRCWRDGHSPPNARGSTRWG